MTTRDYLWATLVIGLCFCLLGRWGWYEDQLRWARINEACLRKALEQKEVRCEK